MTDNLDDDLNDPVVETISDKTKDLEKKETETPAQLPALKTLGAVDRIQAIAPRTIDEAWRLSEAFVLAGMVPDSLKGNNTKETTAKVMTVMLKGMEIGLGPASALQTIMVVNNKPSIYGDALPALLHKSGVIEFIKTNVTGIWGEATKDFVVTITLKRKDQTEPYIRSFGFTDAKKGGLVGKKGPWTNYPERMCYWRALSWAARDGAGDALMGLQVAEEVNDYLVEKRREETADISSLE